MTQHFDHIRDARTPLVEVLTREVRLNREGNTMREPRYVLPYDPALEAEAAELLHNLADPGRDLAAQGVTAMTVDLYDIVLGYLDGEDLWDPIIDVEDQTERDELCMMMQDTVSVNDVLAPAVNEKIASNPDADLAFVTGIGATYPYVRTHTLLTALESTKPVVLMFPGNLGIRSDGQKSLNILGVAEANTGGFYRATNLLDLIPS